MTSAKKAARMPTMATRDGRANEAAMKGPMASSPTREMLPPKIAKTMATAETQTSATRVAIASARSARSLRGLA